MLLRLAAAVAAVLTIVQVLPASAQFSAIYPDRSYIPPPPVPILPAEADEIEVSPIPPAYPPGLPSSPRNPQEPGFIHPNSNAAPAPYGHLPGIRQGAAPVDPAAPRPPGEINTGARPPMDIIQNQQSIISSLPPEDQPEVGEPKELPPQFKRQLVDYRSKEPAGTIVIDTANTYLYLVLGNGKAMRYGIGVGREGFTWSGTEKVSRMAEWPDWYPPEEMIERQPYLPRFMAGGPGNPLGARALYLGKTLFRIHGTNQPSTIGQFVSSGCVRLVNNDIEDLYERVKVGTRVVVLPGKPPATAQAAPQQESATIPVR